MKEPRNTSEPLEGLTTLWRVVHLRLIMLAQGGTTSYNSDGSGHQKPGSKPPAPVDRDVMRLELRWDNSRTNTVRRAILADSLEVLALYMHKPHPDTKPGTLEWKQAIADDPRPSRMVAKMYGVSHATVCEYRKRMGKRIAA